MLNNEQYDALVVGARCAGAATGMLLARAGLRALVIDRGSYGTDTLSTHALMRAAVVQLDRWGLLDAVRTSGAPSIRATTFNYADGDHLTVDIRPDGGVDGLYAPRRHVIDRLLVDAARDAGAAVRFHTSLVGLLRNSDGRVIGARLADGNSEYTVRAGIVVGADGRRSRVAREVGAVTYRLARHATACLYGYVDGLPDRGYEWFYGRGVTAGAIPTHGGHCVFVILPPERFQRAGRSAEDLFAQVLGEAAPGLGPVQLRTDEPLRRTRGEVGFMRQAHGPGWALVGDAGYFKDPVTAHGMTDALRDAELLARAIAGGGDLAVYQNVRDRLSADLFELTDEVASLTWSDEQIKQLLRRLARSMTAEVDHLNGLDRPLTRAA